MLQQLKGGFTGELTSAPSKRAAVKHDGSLFEVLPDAVAVPESTADVRALVSFISAHKPLYPTLSITPRGAGTDMSGAALGSSFILDTAKLNTIHAFDGRLLRAQPGVKLYDMHRMLAAHSLTLGSSPSSRDISTLGGMVANNAAGEQSYAYGATKEWVRALKVVLADGNEYAVKPLNRAELTRKMAENTYEGRLYAHLYSLVNRNYDIIRNAKPHTVRTASGYNLWDVWDKETGIFNLIPLFTGSQGTLGIITDVTIEAVKKPALTASVAVYLPSLTRLSAVLATAKKYQPLSIEGFDDVSFMQALRGHTLLRKQIGKREYAKQQARLLPSAVTLRPHASDSMLLVELGGDTKGELTDAVSGLINELEAARFTVDIVTHEGDPLPLRRTRTATAALLQDQIKSKHAVSFLDDMAVHPSKSAAFLVDLKKILKKYKFPATIHGHFGDGVFHVIPLINVYTPKYAAKLEPLLRALSTLVLRYNGSLSGEHGDGMLRGPWLPAQFNQEVSQLFKEVKELFDPLYIFNPHKKTDASWEYSMSHLRTRR